MNRIKAARRLRKVADALENKLVDSFASPPARTLHVAIHYGTEADGSDMGAIATAMVPVDGDSVTLDLYGHVPSTALYIRSVTMAASSQAREN